MSQFYGTLQGSRGKATRQGGKKSGLTTYTASWDGAIRVEAYYDEDKEQDMVIVSKVQWRGKGEAKANAKSYTTELLARRATSPQGRGVQEHERYYCLLPQFETVRSIPSTSTRHDTWR